MYRCKWSRLLSPMGVLHSAKYRAKLVHSSAELAPYERSCPGNSMPRPAHPPTAQRPRTCDTAHAFGNNSRFKYTSYRYLFRIQTSTIQRKRFLSHAYTPFAALNPNPSAQKPRTSSHLSWSTGQLQSAEHVLLLELLQHSET